MFNNCKECGRYRNAYMKCNHGRDDGSDIGLLIDPDKEPPEDCPIRQAERKRYVDEGRNTHAWDFDDTVTIRGESGYYDDIVGANIGSR